jgi:integrase
MTSGDAGALVPTPDAALAPPRVALPPDRNPVAVYLAGLAAGSRATILGALQTAADVVAPGADAMHFPWWRLRYQHLAAVRARLAETYAPATANKVLSAVRTVLKRCVQLDLMDASDQAKAAGVAPVRGARGQAGRALARREVEALAGACGADAIGRRDRAIVLALALAGLRRHEAARLRLADYDRAARTLRVLGKGNKERSVPVHAGLADALGAWLAVRGEEPGPLFCRVHRGGHAAPARGVSGATVYHVLAALVERAGLAGATPHDLRRTLISELLDRGVDLAAVADTVGHADVNTTRRYDRRGERAKRRGIDGLDWFGGGS